MFSKFVAMLVLFAGVATASPAESSSSTTEAMESSSSTEAMESSSSTEAMETSSSTEAMETSSSTGAPDETSSSTGAPPAPASPELVAMIKEYPGTMPAAMFGEAGIDTETGMMIKFTWELMNLEASKTGGIHIHSGMTCDTASLVGGHYYDATKWNSTSEPWHVVKWVSNADGKATASAMVDYGKTLMESKTHAVVVHDSTGARVGCGVLMPSSDSTTPGATTTKPAAATTTAPGAASSAMQASVSLFLVATLALLL